MKKLLSILVILLFASTLYAQEGGKKKSFSVGITLGMVSDLAGLGATIIDDGTLDTAGGSLANATGTDKLIMADKSDAVLLSNSNNTNAVPLQFLSDFSEAGPMMGLSIGGYVMYDFLSLADLPFFARLGFDYVAQVGGGEHGRTLGAGINQYAQAAGYALPTAAAGGTYTGAWMTYSFTSSWLEIPLTVGICLPVGKYGKVYGGLGISYFNGGWALEVDMSDSYAQYITVFDDGAQALVTSFDKTKVEFKVSQISFNFVLGAEVNVAYGIAVTFEYWGSGAAQTVYSKAAFTDNASKTMTAALSGGDVAGYDTNWFKQFAYPVVLGSSYFKFGVKYYIF